MKKFQTNPMTRTPMKMKRNAPKPASIPATSQVHIEFNHPSAKAISVAGTFNAWSPEATPMVSSGEGRWLKDMALEPGIYEYRLVVDGEWLPDPRATETAANPFGGLNSVLVVTAGTS
jgi:1,4-alpha-glucan branching enzyme